jgi:FAD/FMN-containing dehydrogenase
LHLKCEGWGDLCNGSLNLQLLSLHDHPDPSLPFKQFLVVWASLLQKEGGFLVNRYGIGQLLSPYLPPFYDEEELLFLKELSLSFDPQQLFNRHRVLPVEGKSLEKIRI